MEMQYFGHLVQTFQIGMAGFRIVAADIERSDLIVFDSMVPAEDSGTLKSYHLHL